MQCDNSTVLSKRIGTLANVSLPFLAITLHVFVLFPNVAAHMKAEIIGYTMQLNSSYSSTSINVKWASKDD